MSSNYHDILRGTLHLAPKIVGGESQIVVTTDSSKIKFIFKASGELEDIEVIKDWGPNQWAE